MKYLLMLSFSLLIALFSVSITGNTAEIPGIIKIEATEKASPPEWAVLERNLIKACEDAAPLFLEKFTYRDGSLKQHGKIDDDYECFISWPLLYAIGGDEKILDEGFKEFNAITRQWTYDWRQSVKNEFVRQYDMLHLSEGYVGFQYFGLADPYIPENIERAKRFAGYYMNEFPDAFNYDPKYKVIRSIATGSDGPAESQGGWGTLLYGHASLYPLVKEIDPAWEKDQARQKELQELYDKVVVPCDSPINLAITGLITNAYLYTGDEKYKKWVLEYVDAWIDRIKENNGIIPDNVGRTGKIGEYRNGQWWGGFFGWDSRYSIEIMYNGIMTASECAYLVSGDPKYLELLRSQINVLLSRSKEGYGNLLVPYKHGPNGWYDYRPFMPDILSHLWHSSLDKNDFALIQKIHANSKVGPRSYAYATSPNPPAPGSEEWHPDGSVMNWDDPNDDINQWNENRYNESAHLRYLEGVNPDWPEKILRADLKMLRRNIERMKSADYQHEWASQTMIEQRAVFTNGLQQVTMGAPHTGFNGGLLRAHVRYFDPDRERPGLPPDVSALVNKIEAERTVIELVNLSINQSRNVIVQAGAFGEHEFTEIRFTLLTSNKDGKPIKEVMKMPVNGKFFEVTLPPSTSITIDIGNKRFVNKPGYDFPWKVNFKR